MMPLLMPCFAYHLPLSLNYNTLTWKIQARFLSQSSFQNADIVLVPTLSSQQVGVFATHKAILLIQIIETKLIFSCFWLLAFHLIGGFHHRTGIVE